MEDYIREKVRETLVKFRLEAELTQTEVGKQIGKSKTAVASWEQGISSPDIVTLYKLARIYGKKISEMYGEEVDSNDD